MSLSLVEGLKAKPAAVAPLSPDPTGLKSLDELMREQREKNAAAVEGDASVPRVKTLQELMQESRAKTQNDAATDVVDAGVPRSVKTLQELMTEARANKAAADVDAGR